jgi:hypothetical protein
MRLRFEAKDDNCASNPNEEADSFTNDSMQNSYKWRKSSETSETEKIKNETFRSCDFNKIKLYLSVRAVALMLLLRSSSFLPLRPLLLLFRNGLVLRGGGRWWRYVLHLLDLLVLAPRQAVHGNGEKDVEEDVVAEDEEDDEVQAGDQAQLFGSAVGNDSVVHDRVPVLARQHLETEDETKTFGS